MALRKRQPTIRLKKSSERLSAMIRVDKQHAGVINYGGDLNPLTKKEFEKQISACISLLDEYNLLLERAGGKSKEIYLAEEELGEMFTRVLAGAKSIFGINSDEVESLGGTKKSARKKSGKHVKEI